MGKPFSRYVRISAAGWAGSLYPAGLKASDELTFCADHFETAEVDSMF
jgi:uncharacterized protein YecE (DUF72 family)